jgi:hypothetical protein
LLVVGALKPPSISSPKRCGLKAEHARKVWEFYTGQKIWNPNAEANAEGVRTAIQSMGKRGLLKAPPPNPA